MSPRRCLDNQPVWREQQSVAGVFKVSQWQDQSFANTSKLNQSSLTCTYSYPDVLLRSLGLVAMPTYWVVVSRMALECSHSS